MLPVMSSTSLPIVSDLHLETPAAYDVFGITPKALNFALLGGIGDVECWKTKSVKLWAFGHTHFNCDYTDESSGNRVVTNQRGYYFAQSAGFECDKVIELGNA